MEGFNRNGVLPGYVEVSLEAMVKTRQLMTVESLLADSTSSSSSSASLLWSFMGSMVSLLTSSAAPGMAPIDGPTSSPGRGKQAVRRYCSVRLLQMLEKAVEEAARGKPAIDLVLSMTAKQATSKHSFSHFLAEAGAAYQRSNPRLQALLETLSVSDQDLLARYLTSCGLVVQLGPDVIQILPNRKKPAMAAESGLAMLRVKLTLEDIERRLEALRRKETELTASAVHAKRRGDMQAAMMNLRLRKSSAEAATKLQSAMLALAETVQAVEGMETNKMIIDGYRAASAALHSSRKESKLTADSVEAAIDQFQDEMDNMREVDDAISAAMAGAEPVWDMTSLEQELDALMLADSVVVKSSGTPSPQKVRDAAAAVDGSATMELMSPVPATPTFSTRAPPIDQRMTKGRETKQTHSSAQAGAVGATSTALV